MRGERPGTVAELVTSPPARRHWIGVFVFVPLNFVSQLFIRRLAPKEAGWRGCQRRWNAYVGSIKIRGVKRRDRLPAEARADVRGRLLDVQSSKPAPLTPRILMLP